MSTRARYRPWFNEVTFGEEALFVAWRAEVDEREAPFPGELGYYGEFAIPLIESVPRCTWRFEGLQCVLDEHLPENGHLIEAWRHGR